MTFKSQTPIGSVRMEKAGLQWIRFGVPVERGMLLKDEICQLIDRDHQRIPSDITAVSLWHDGTVKWVIVDALVNQSGPLFFVPTEAASKNEAASDAQQQAQVYTEADGSINVAEAYRLLPTITLHSGQSLALKVDVECNLSNRLTEHSRVHYHCVAFPLLSIELNVFHIAATCESRITIMVHNSAASEHKNGCWDLGDPNSLNIDSLSLSVYCLQQLDHVEFTGIDDNGTEMQQAVSGQVKVHQYGSGGAHWNSPVHRDKTGQVRLKAQGYRIEVDGSDDVQQGKRCEPQINVKSSGQLLRFSPKKFWQNAPAALVVSSSGFEWQLFPELTELQPGESKTWEINVGPEPDLAVFYLNPNYINQCLVLLGVNLVSRNDWASILDAGIEGASSFFAKREQCDEYGWRHFGELYADHEALYTEPDSGIFVSHYNNQYDPLLGLQLRFLGSGQTEWSELAQALKQHVFDIDLYKTQLDKAEYNNGLFWHTDHYLPALTATHRTYSTQHTAAYDGHQGGGGPGGQHCYTSGLAMHYFLTGDEQARDAVLNLMRWVRCFYNGPDSLLSRLYRFLTIDMKPGQMTNIGLVPSGYKYPLDRGTANYLNALIDGYQIEPSNGLLDEMFSVISQTVTPFDNLSLRHLDDVENAWFYIVFLQVLARYLLLKEQLEQNDSAYGYARCAFVHYASWVRENEQPYLTAPEKLEFPNDTWAAQDIRKANVLYYAAYFDPERAQKYLERAEFFWHYCIDRLSASEERSTTRILSILMQNQGVREWQQHTSASAIPMPDIQPNKFPCIGPWRRLARDAWRIARRFSWRTEWHWLKTRLVRR